MGARLAQLGFQHVIGVDLSAAMLAEAERKNCYTQLVCNTYIAAEAATAAAPLSTRMRRQSEEGGKNAEAKGAIFRVH